MKLSRLSHATLVAAAIVSQACSSSDSGSALPPGAGGGGAGGGFQHMGGSGGTSSGGAPSGAGGSHALDCPTPSMDAYPPVTLAAFTPPSDPGPKGILLDVSGEVLAFGGYPFPAAQKGDPVFVDGWEVKFSRLLVTVDHITLRQNPDKNPGDESQTDAEVQNVSGPWAVDLHKKGPLAGKGGADETAIPIAAFAGQSLDSTARYAFGFDVVAATASAKNVNLDPAALADYAEMVAKGYAVYYVGTATFKGSGCVPESPAFDELPKVVDFRLGFATPTTYVNCQNPDNDPAKGFPNEEHQRGIAIKENASVIAQLTFHTDHPFWDSVVHDSPPHFDPIAAQYTCVPAGTTPTARVEDMAGVDFEGFRDRGGNKLPWRSCVGAAFVPPDTGAMHFDPQSVPIDPSSADGSKLRDYRDYLTYNQSTQGHLNSNGLCFVKRGYPSPLLGEAGRTCGASVRGRGSAARTAFPASPTP